MINLKPKLMLSFLIVFVPFSIFTCSPKKSIDINEAEAEAGAEIWELQVTGESEGNLKMLLWRIKIENDIYSITGKISGKIKDHRSGTGTVDYKLEGRIERGNLKANLRGIAKMGAGHVPSTSRISGKIFNSKGWGQYTSAAALGSSHGYYIMRKIHKPAKK